MKAKPNDQILRESSKVRTASNDRITFRILIPLVVAIGILLAAFIFAFHRDQEQRSARSTDRSSQEVQKLLRMEQEQKTALLTTTIDAIENDGQLEQRFRARDRMAVLQRAMPLFQSLKKRHAITHFYFELPDRTVFLRMHSPGLSGDKVDRFTMIESERTGAVASGIEHGVTGAFTLRVVSPWREKGELLGYLELGVEFENIVQSVHSLLNANADFIVTIDKQFLDRRVWDAARASKDERNAWDQFPFEVIINKTVGFIPQPIIDHLKVRQTKGIEKTQFVVSRGRSLQLVFLPLIEVSGKTVGQLIVIQDTTLTTEQARSAIRNIIFLCLIVSSALLGLFYLLLTRIERTLGERASKLHDEIGERSRTENELREAQGQLVETSRRAGMAEVATSVLHNVGNVLNSVNIASSGVAESLRKSKSANLSKVVALMREHETDLGEFLTNDPKGKQLPGYLAQLAEYLTSEQDVILKELEGLQKNIEHIKDIVTMQQGFAKVSGFAETLRVADVVEDALRMNASGLLRHDVQVITECGNIPPVTMERSKVMQILVNLISNAKYACDNSTSLAKRLVIRSSNGHGHVRIAVSDNGIGIPNNNLSRIFAHGFTTRKDGHGFGLHSAAIAAKEMGGSLTVQSDGLNRGATFTLEFPLPSNS